MNEAGTVVYPRLVRRVRALLVDSFLGIVIVLTWWALLPYLVNASGPVKFAYPAIAFLIMEPVLVSMTGGTPGHHLLGLRVQSRKSGANLGPLRSIVRTVVRLFFGWLSFLPVLTTRNHQAIHDLVIGSIVVLRKPGAVSKAERIAERVPDVDHYIYPKKWKRLVAIGAYFMAITSLWTGAIVELLSEKCLKIDQCTFLESASQSLLAYLWIFGVGWAIVAGCNCQLVGARRKKREIPSEP